MLWKMKSLRVILVVACTLLAFLVWSRLSLVAYRNRIEKSLAWMSRANQLLLNTRLQLRDGGRLETLAGYLGEDAPFSWRALTVAAQIGDGSYVLPEGETHWYDSIYYPMDAPNRENFGLHAEYVCDGKASCFAVIGRGSAIGELLKCSADRDDLPGDAVILMDARLPNYSWMQPLDVTLPPQGSSESTKLPPLASKAGRALAFADGQVWLLHKSTPVHVVAPFLSVSGAMERNRDDELRAYCICRLHGGDVETYQIGKVEWFGSSGSSE